MQNKMSLLKHYILSIPQRNNQQERLSTAKSSGHNKKTQNNEVSVFSPHVYG